MKRPTSNLFLLLLVSILVIMLALSCEGATNQNSNSEYVWGDCPGVLLAQDIGTRVEDLPPGWCLWDVQTGPTCEYPFRIRNEAFTPTAKHQFVFADTTQHARPANGVQVVGGPNPLTPTFERGEQPKSHETANVLTGVSQA